MKITDLLKPDTIIMELQATTKEAVIDELVAKLDEAGRLADRNKFKEAILKREASGSTGIGDGIAIPHAKTDAVKTPSICFGKSVQGIDYETLDGQPAHLFFMIAAGEGADEAHLETLSRLSVLLMDSTFRQQLEQAHTAEELVALIQDKELENEPEETATTDTTEQLILAVTACPTGIAHTYMAADALNAKAREMGLTIKVETNGSTGVKNKLTPEDIAQATAIIVAADKQVEMSRFHGKPVIQVRVAEAIHQPERLLTAALRQEAPLYVADNTSRSSESSRGGAGFYKHLMNGVSNMLPFVVGGGVLIALAFAWGGIEAKGPVAEMLMKIGSEGAFHFLVPILAGFIAMSIADRPSFAPGVVGGFLAASAQAGFLGGLIAGFLAGYIVVGLKKVLAFIPEQLDGIKPVLLYPVLGTLLTGILMITVVNGPVGALNKALSAWLSGLSGTNAVLLGVILGGMMAADMGGPINKAAFTFGLACMEASNFGPHAAVMAGGMVPPLGIALATTFFKRKFSDSERKAGLTNYLLGASFITEGAIPFAAADPLRVLASCIVGAAVAGGLSLWLGITLPAPHGGLFVIPLVNKPFHYAAAIVVGSLVTAIALGIWKRPRQD
ncbi:PTS fructose transporter subunit IIABC [Laceyella sacchari]|uniref:Fructose-specific PTS transporter subunit EIIC n=1 Tax=Laceyella sacchari TaxID=37482 RepID=A0ABY5U0S5_LACSH|nr:PTS fructose transporter subunit IIABC [Laceyella sacchari]UWE03251.1 fructose-specific PTS transporter subunit EIIC [Laceyella sacchari]